MADSLDVLAARAAGEPFFLAWVLAAYAHSEKLDDTGLAAVLGCPAKELVMLRLCRTPRTDPHDFWEDLTTIAERFGIDPGHLADAVKRGRVVRRFQQAEEGSGGSLMAARDREDEPPVGP